MWKESRLSNITARSLFLWKVSIPVDKDTVKYHRASSSAGKFLKKPKDKKVVLDVVVILQTTTPFDPTASLFPLLTKGAVAAQEG
jgi:hypothetical protein